MSAKINDMCLIADEKSYQGNPPGMPAFEN